MATSIIISTLTSLHVWAKLFPYYQWSKSLLLYSSLLYVCEASSSLRVCSPTFLLSSCGFKNNLYHSLFQAHLKPPCAIEGVWCVCVCVKLTIQAWSNHGVVVCMHSGEIVDECCLRCCSGLTNSSLHLVEWGSEEYLCVWFWVCVCVCVESACGSH